MTGNRENDVKSVASVLNEMGVGGLNIEVASDNEPYLVDLMAKDSSKSNARAYHWWNIFEYRPVERAVGIAKEGIYTNWLAFEQHCTRVTSCCRNLLQYVPHGLMLLGLYRPATTFVPPHMTMDIRVNRRLQLHTSSRPMTISITCGCFGVPCRSSCFLIHEWCIR